LIKIDDCIRRPNLLLEFLARHYLAGPFHQSSQKIKWLPLQFHFAALFEELSGVEIDLEYRETD
jgi:hypothetical protein